MELDICTWLSHDAWIGSSTHNRAPLSRSSLNRTCVLPACLMTSSWLRRASPNASCCAGVRRKGLLCGWGGGRGERAHELSEPLEWKCFEHLVSKASDRKR